MLLYRSLNFCDGFFRFRHVSLSVTQRRHAGCNSRAFSILPRSNSIVQRMCVHFPWAYLQHPYRRQPRTWQMMVRRPIPRIYIYRWLLVLHLAWLNEFHSYGQPVCAHRKKNRMRRNKIRRINEYYRSQTTNKPYVNQQHQRIQKFHSFWKFLHSTSSNKLKIRGDTKRRMPRMIVLVRIQILDAVRRSTRQWQRILTSMCKPGNENILTAGISLGVYRKNSRAPLYHLTAYSASSSVSWSQISCAISPLSTALGMVTCNIRNPNDSSVRAPKMRKIKIKFFRKLVRMWENLRHADVDVDGMRSRSTLMPEWIISL